MIRCSTTLANSTLGLPSSSSLFSPSDESDDIQTKQDISVNLAAFSSGFDEVVPRELVSSWEWEDLELLVCGLQDINVISWEQATTYEPKPPPHCTLAVTTETRARWFWDAVKSMNSEQKHALLHFWTAFRKLPHTGSRGLRFNLRFDDQKSSNHLPMAQTCFFTLRVPNYASYEETKEKLLKAISECCFALVSVKKNRTKNASARVPEKKGEKSSRAAVCAQKTDRQTDRQTRCSKSRKM